jgi:hypothetical protein
VGNIEYHKEGANLYGYRGDVRAEKANIIVRRAHVGNASNDIGFRFDEENKCYYPVISAYDSRTGYGEDWLNKLRQEYATERVVSKLKKSGRKYNLETRDGKRVVTVT